MSMSTEGDPDQNPIASVNSALPISVFQYGFNGKLFFLIANLPRCIIIPYIYNKVK